jgi:hypothetical protein
MMTGIEIVFFLLCPCSSSPRRCLAWQHRTPAGYAVTSPHPDQGLITALPMEVTAVMTAVSSDSVLWSL